MSCARDDSNKKYTRKSLSVRRVENGCTKTKTYYVFAECLAIWGKGKHVGLTERVQRLYKHVWRGGMGGSEYVAKSYTKHVVGMTGTDREPVDEATPRCHWN